MSILLPDEDRSIAAAAKASEATPLTRSRTDSPDICKEHDFKLASSIELAAGPRAPFSIEYTSS